MATKRLTSAKRQEQIVKVALRILASKHSLTLAELSKDVGIADASILKHFRGKTAIVDAVIEHFVALLEEDLPDDIDDPTLWLNEFFVRRLSRIQKNSRIMSLAFTQTLRDSAGTQGKKRLKAHESKSNEAICEAIAEAQKDELIDPAFPAQMWTWILIGVLRGAALGLPGLESDKSIKKLDASDIWELLEEFMVPR